MESEVFVAESGVSRETLARLEVFASELARWQAVKNLVGTATLQDVWSRHIADSLQLLSLAPTPRTWLDLGSGAGLPGLVIAIALASEPGAVVHLIESNGRKCAFLRHVARLTDAPAEIHCARIEDVIADFVGRTEIVTARALAPLDRLIDLAYPVLASGVPGLFPKGREVGAELTVASESWTFESSIFPSRTDPEGRIVRLQSVERR